MSRSAMNPPLRARVHQTLKSDCMCLCRKWPENYYFSLMLWFSCFIQNVTMCFPLCLYRLHEAYHCVETMHKKTKLWIPRREHAQKRSLKPCIFRFPWNWPSRSSFLRSYLGGCKDSARSFGALRTQVSRRDLQESPIILLINLWQEAIALHHIETKGLNHRETYLHKEWTLP